MHAIQVVVTDDAERSRLTVFFRLLLAIPHLIWLALWSIAAFFAAIAGWFAALFTAQLPDALHGFLERFLRYSVHVYAYLFLIADPFPGFGGAPGAYPVDLTVAPPERQNRWAVAFRLVLAIPALVLAAALGSGWSSSTRTGSEDSVAYSSNWGLLATVGVLGWFAVLARSRMPIGMRNAGAFGIQYGAQAGGYLLLLTGRYPDADPGRAPIGGIPEHPVRLAVDDDLRRSRLTVLFRLLLAIPHFIWLTLWAIAAFFAAIAMWVATLVRAQPAPGLHRFLAAYVRYWTQLGAYLQLAADPYPGFEGRPGSYPVDVTLGAPERQDRWTVFFRLVLGFPAFLLSSALGGAALVAAVLGWFAVLATGRMPRQLRNLVTWSLRYSAQAFAYILLLVGRYPFSGPPADAPQARPS